LEEIKASIGKRSPAWSDEEQGRLRMLLNDGVSYAQAALSMNKTVANVKHVARQLHLPLQLLPWTVQEDATLARVYPNLNLSREQILTELPGRTWSATVSRANARGIIRLPKKQYTVVSDYFSVVDTVEKAYWLGFLAADGSVFGKNKISIGLATKDKGHLQRLVDTICPGYELRDLPKTKAVKMQISDEAMRKDLESLGVVPNKSNSLTWPQKLPTGFELPFILGLFDGDGCLSYSNTKNSWQWSLAGTESILSSVKERMEDHFGFSFGSIHKRTHTAMCSIQVTGYKAVQVDAVMSSFDVGLERKRIRSHPRSIG
jgi:hypothetical protein